MRKLSPAKLILIGGRIKALRVAMEYTIKELSVESDLAEYTIRHVERGDYSMACGYVKVGAAMGIKVLKILDVSEDRWQLFLGQVSSRNGTGRFLPRTGPALQRLGSLYGKVAARVAVRDDVQCLNLP